jgi:serine/threonine kinase 16
MLDCHRDIKPANILLANDLTAVLTDLGSASAAAQPLQSHREAMALQEQCEELCTMSYRWVCRGACIGVRCGLTLCHRAPELFEVFSHTIVDERTDVWSLGCVLYYVTYGIGPFDEAYSKGGSLRLAAVGGAIKYPTTPERFVDDDQQRAIAIAGAGAVTDAGGATDHKAIWH